MERIIMDDKNNTFTLDELTPEEKRRIIAALSMGKLSEEEKQQFRDACARSQLTEAERMQIKRAFSLSRLTDEERRALIARKQQQSQTQTQMSFAASSPNAQTAPQQNTPHKDAAEMHNAVSQQHPAAPPHTEIPTAAVLVQRPTAAPQNHTDANDATRSVSTASIQKQAERQHQNNTATQAAIAANKIHDITPQRVRKKEKDIGDKEYDEETDHTAITSLLKGIVYIVSVLVISIFASWAVIEVGNDVFAFVKDDEVVSVVIEEDMTAKDVAQMLYKNGIIKYPTMYELYVRLKKESTDYLVGEYEISPSMNYGDINDTFTYIANTREQVVITIPEGYTVDQIIDLMLKNGIGTREGFVDAINNYEFTDFRFLEEMKTLDPDRKYRLEGYLFPDTYYFFKDSSEVAVIYKFLQNFDKKITDAYYERAAQLGMSIDEIITLSSMIQAEGLSLTDFENISSVFHNRLNNPRLFPQLQSDATLQYILDKRKVSLTASDLLIDSKYNSYLYAGLPPGAICNPGMDAINCALYPAETDYYYFLADGKGNTYFSKTNEEHEALKKEYLQ
ncbi:MAG: endolytic transglycosylase MltG [Clostridia bacterium]|nr:endolytic transglycosylase MltG [Clostridia bacterium]